MISYHNLTARIASATFAHTETGRQVDKKVTEMDRQTNRQIDRRTDRQTDRQADRHRQIGTDGEPHHR